MSAPAQTVEKALPYRQLAGGDVVIRSALAPDDQIRCWVAGEAFPRIVLDIPTGNVLTGTGGSAPTALGGGGGGLSPALPSGDIFVGNASNVATGVAMSGDVTITNAGVATVGALPESRITNLVSDLALKAPIASPTFTGITTAPEFSASGLTGATAASRYVGATATGAPASGTFAVGDFVVDQTGKFWICTAAGTPGTWTNPGGGGSLPDPVTAAHGGTGLTTLTAHALVIGEGTANVGLVGPGATVGIPLVAQGAAADPAFGTAVVAGGGTGATSFTAHGVLVGEGTSAFAATAVGTTGVPLIGQTGADPVFGTAVVAGGGTGQTTAAAARAASGLNIEAFHGVADAAYTILATDHAVLWTSITAARIATLPAANALNPGQILRIGDASGSCSATNTISIARAGADTINGAATSLVISNAYGLRELISDGVSAWTSRVAGVAGGGTGLSTLTAHALLVGEGASPVALVGPGATSGVPLIAQGASADPTFGTAVVAGGGTGATTLAAHGLLVGNGTSAVNVTGAGTPGQVLTSNGASADPSFQAAAGGGGANFIFGDGSDGSPTFDGTTTILGVAPTGGNTYTMNRDWFLASPTINNGIIIITNGFRLFCSGTITNNGSIRWNGVAAVLDAAGGSINNTNSSIINTTGSSSAGTPGANGATGNGTAAAGQGGNSFGGAGGNGGTGATTTAGAGGAVSGPTANQGSLRNGMFTALGFLVVGQGISPAGKSLALQGGNGGGAGGGDATNKGGGGGGGGGVVLVAAKTFAGTGTIQARGGAGGNGAVASTLGAGGGGGGGGGYVLVISSSTSGGAITGQTIDANGGAGGTHTGATATDGSTGAAGTTVILPN